MDYHNMKNGLSQYEIMGIVLYNVDCSNKFMSVNSVRL